MSTTMDVETLTENEKGALALSTTGAKRLDLFTQAVRKISETQLIQLIEASWKEDPLDTLKILFYTRDCRGGKGERQIFTIASSWLIQHHPDEFLANLDLVVEFGRWEDLLWHINCANKTVSDAIAKKFAKQLLDDKEAMNSGKPVTLCAKWCPTENGKHDKKLGASKIICQALGCDYKTYRKNYLSPLREYIKVVERLMCGKRWKEIDYSKVPGNAMNKLKKAFAKNDGERYKEWQTKLASGDKSVKVNATTVEPHDIVRQFMAHNAAEDITAEEQWKVILERVKGYGTMSDSLVLSDVSGSMSGTPMEVSIALGLLISQLTAAPFNNQILTFESNPHFHIVQGNSLRERVKNVMSMSWGGSTNFVAAFDLILNTAAQNNLPPSAMPKRLYVISDMQFDQACEGAWVTHHKLLQAKYAQAGYNMPEIVYWNVRATSTFVVGKDEPGVAMVSGFSPSVLKAVLTGKKITPWTVLREAIDDKRYEKVRLANK